MWKIVGYGEKKDPGKREASLYPSLSELEESDISIHPGLCVTSIQYEKFTHAANLSKELSRYLLGNWSGEFEQQLEKL